MSSRSHLTSLTRVSCSPRAMPRCLHSSTAAVYLDSLRARMNTLSIPCSRSWAVISARIGYCQIVLDFASLGFLELCLPFPIPAWPPCGVRQSIVLYIYMLRFTHCDHSHSILEIWHIFQREPSVCKYSRHVGSWQHELLVESYVTKEVDVIATRAIIGRT
jgi:hypothetical protein